MRRRRNLALLLLCWWSQSRLAGSCSTLVAGRLATVDGSVLLTHSNDGDGDAAGNLNSVKAQRYPPNATRAVSRGSIPQVSHTYAYLREGYAAMNEHQVALGESTCSGVFSGAAGQILNIVDLGEIALERARTAREAILVMGNLSETFGYYDNGESLMVIDPNEAWIFHVLPDDTGHSSIWVALRVPDDHIGTVDNAFTIREMTLDDPHIMLYSSNIPSIAESHGWWSPSEPLDFTAVFSGPNESTQKYTSGRRMWVVYDTFAPSRNFSAAYADYTTDSPYPSTVRPDFQVDVAAFMAMMRNDYENTSFDLTQGLAAGAFGTPSRWVTPQTVNGQSVAWERPISTFKSIVSYVAQARNWLPNAVGGTLWFAPDCSKTSCYVPFYPAQDSIPAAYALNAQSTLGRNESAWWAHRYLYNIVQLRYDLMILDVVKLQQLHESRSLELQAYIDLTYPTGALSMSDVTEMVNTNALQVVRDFWALSDDLVMAYADGYCNGCDQATSRYLGYPAWWLEAVDAPLNPVMATTTTAVIPDESATPAEKADVLRSCVSACRLPTRTYDAKCVDLCVFA
jgi:dipeptidase